MTAPRHGCFTLLFTQETPKRLRPDPNISLDIIKVTIITAVKNPVNGQGPTLIISIACHSRPDRESIFSFLRCMLLNNEWIVPTCLL